MDGRAFGIIIAIHCSQAEHDQYSDKENDQKNTSCDQPHENRDGEEPCTVISIGKGAILNINWLNLKMFEANRASIAFHGHFGTTV